MSGIGGARPRSSAPRARHPGRESGRARLLLAVSLLLFASIFGVIWLKSSAPRVPPLTDADVASDPNLPETIPTLRGPVDRHLVADACKRRDMWACRDLFADLYEGGHKQEAMGLLRSMTAAFEAMPAALRHSQQVDRMFEAAKIMVAADGSTGEMAPGEIAILGIGTRNAEQEAADKFVRTRAMRWSSEPRPPLGTMPPQLKVVRSPGQVQLTNITGDHLVATVFGEFRRPDLATGRSHEFQCYWIDPATREKVGRERVALAPGQARTLEPDCARSASVEEGRLDFVVFDGEKRQWVFLSSGY